MQTEVQKYRITALVVLICVATIVAVIAVGQRDSTATTPSGSPFSGQGSPVGGSPFSGQGSPVGMIQTMGWKPAVDTGTASFTAQADAMTAAQMQQLGLSATGCSGTYWTWRGHFRSVRNSVLFYEFGPINYWCGTAKGNVSKAGWGWVNKCGAYGGVYAFKGCSRSHTPFGYPSVHVIDTWHYHLTKADDDRYPSVDYDLFANGGVSGNVYYG